MLLRNTSVWIEIQQGYLLFDAFAISPCNDVVPVASSDVDYPRSTKATDNAAIAIEARQS